MSSSKEEPSAASKDRPAGAEDALLAWEAAGNAAPGTLVRISAAETIERDLERARGLPGTSAGRPPGGLANRPIVIKDNIHVAGLPCTAATPALRDFVPSADAGAVARLRERGMVVIGKANMHELALGVTSTHTAIGPVENAVLPGRVAGGSSGGTAAAVAAGVCACGLGSDTGGSTRIPAAFNDIWGFRPSTGRYPQDGAVSIAYSRDTVGPMTVDLASLRLLDAALALDGGAVSSGPADPKTLRVGFDPADADRCDPETTAALRETLERLNGAAGISLVEVDLGPLDRFAAAFEPELGAQELAPSLDCYLRGDPGLPSLERVMETLVDPHVAQMLEGSRAAVADGVWSEALHRLLNECARARSAYLGLVHRGGIDAVLRPTVPILPPRIDDVVGLDLDGRNRLFGVLTDFTRLATVVGSPSLSIPLGPSLGHHGIGILLDGIPGCDEELLAVAARLEAALRY